MTTLKESLVAKTARHCSTKHALYACILDPMQLPSSLNSNSLTMGNLEVQAKSLLQNEFGGQIRSQEIHLSPEDLKHRDSNPLWTPPKTPKQVDEGTLCKVISEFSFFIFP